MRKHSIVVLTVVIFTLALVMVTLAADPHVGTWNINLAKSNFNGPPWKSDTITWTTQDNGIQLVEDLVEADGKVYHIGFAGKYDGTDYPVTGYAVMDTMAMRKSDANTFEVVFKKAGKEVARVHEVFSKDGKTWTSTIKGKDAKGLDFNVINVYDKQ
jgi:hypothetical protein